MNDDRIDLSALDPTKDERRFEGMVRAIMANAADELRARQARSVVMGQLVRWRRPMLAAATVLLLVSAAVLTRVHSNAATVDPRTDLAQAMGVPTRLAQWIGSDELPTTTQLLETVGANP